MDNNTHPTQGGQPANHVPISGSDRAAVPNAQKVGPADPNERMTVTLVIRRSSLSPDLSTVIDTLSASPLSTRRHLSHEEFATSYGLSSADLTLVEAFARGHGLDVIEVNSAAGTVTLSGVVSAFTQAFGVNLDTYQHPDFTYRGRTGHVHVPAHLSDIVLAVLGLDNRPQTGPHFRLYEESEGSRAAASQAISYTPPQVAQLYDFPRMDCSSQSIALIELGGGYRPTDLSTYFTNLGVPQPTMVDVSVDGAKNRPTGDPGGPDGEVVLDIEVAGSVAQAARIVVYFAPNTDAGFLKAITTAIHDATNKPSVISISWGGPEDSWTPQAIAAMNRAFQDAATLGVTVCCASGDNGSSDGVNDGSVHVDFPASSPYVLACGGTRLVGSGQTITSESVWNDGTQGGATGGGVSDVFPLPAWQTGANVPLSANAGGKVGRGVPDVAGDADPATGYQVFVDGQQFPVGGTSAVAPLWAGLIAMINQQLGHPVGFINPTLYSLPPQVGAFHDITTGNNNTGGNRGPYDAGPGWDPCTGLGSPDGTRLMNALGQTNG